MRNQAIERLDERRRLAACGIEGHGTAERDHGTDALRCLMCAVHGEQAAQAPAHEAHRPAALVVHVADLLLERSGVPAVESDVAPESPRLDLVAAVLQKELEHDQRALVRHEAGQQQHRVAVAARRSGEHRKVPRQRCHLEQGTRLDDLVQQAGLADVGLSSSHLVPDLVPGR